MENHHSPVDTELVREFCDIAQQHDLVALDVSYKEFRLKVTRAPEVAYAAPTPGPISAAPPPGGSEAHHPNAPAAADDRKNLTAVTSPLAGVFYRAVRPGAPPFVNEGDEVRAGQTLCIIEAMKLMNEITAEARGRVRRILVDNAQVVESGQEIMLLEPLA